MSCYHDDISHWDDENRLRCRVCDGYVVAGKRCLKCLNRKTAAREAAHQKAEAAARDEHTRLEATQASAWRMRALHRYTAKVLAMRGAERLAFMEEHSVSELFR